MLGQHKNMEPAEILKWLGETYPEYGLKIQEILIPSVPAPSNRSKRNCGLFKDAFYGRDSLQHGWLKWFSLNYLSFMANYEVEIFIPPVLGRYGNGAGRVLPKGHSYRAIPGCRFQRADLCGFDTLIEVGVTSPQALVEPLWCYAVKKIVWLPFQNGNIHEEWQDFSYQNKAFLLMRDSSHKRL